MLTENYINNFACQFHQSRNSKHQEVNETSIDIKCSWMFSLINTTRFWYLYFPCCVWHQLKWFGNKNIFVLPWRRTWRKKNLFFCSKENMFNGMNKITINLSSFVTFDSLPPATQTRTKQIMRHSMKLFELGLVSSLSRSNYSAPTENW